MAQRQLMILTLLAMGCAGQTDPDSSGRDEPSVSQPQTASDEGRNDPADCEYYQQVLDCVTPQGYEGNQYCEIGQDGYVLTECVQNVSTTGTPIVLVFDETPVTFTHPAGNFDLFGLGTPVASAWVAAQTPWLALDRDGNGRIDDGHELFGSMTELSTGQRAAQGFEALAELDEDSDGFVTPSDAMFSKLRIWRDKDQDRSSSSDELVGLAEAGVLALEVSYEERPRCSLEGCERERARFFFQGATGVEIGALVDVHLNGYR